MSLIKCRCKKSQMNFAKLTEKDLPDGYEAECCAKTPAEEPKEEAATAPEAEPEAPAAEEPKAAEPAPAPRRGRGRKPTETPAS
jgi:Predicted membrane protein